MEEHKSYITDSTGRETELSQHGIYFARGGAVELLTFQSVEQVLANDWQEEDGLEIHAKSIVRTCPYINLRFIIVGSTREQFEERLAFFRKLLDSYFLIINPAHLGRDGFHIDHLSFEAYRHLGRPLYSSGTKAGEVTVRCRLKMGISLDGRRSSEVVPPAKVKLGSKDFSEFGIQIEEAYSSLLLPPSFKEGTFKRKSGEVGLNCLLLSETYEGIINSLSRLREAVLNKQFYLMHGAGKVRCYYTSMTNLRELPTTQKKGIAFTLNFKTT